MKPKYILFGLLALIGASCTNDDLNEVAGMKQNGIQVTAGLDANTRVGFEQDGDVTHAFWEEGDQITLYAPSQGALNYQVSTLGEGGYSATFSAIDDVLKNTDETIYAAHRADMEADIADGMATLPNTDTWTDEHPMPFAYAISNVADGKVNLSFQHIFAYLKLTLNAETVAGSDVKEITDVYLTNPSGAPISIAAGRFDFSTQSIVEDKGVNYINYSLQESFTATGTAEKSIYIPILPQAAGETIHLAVLHKHEAGCDTLLTINKETPATGFLAGRAYTYSPKSPFFRDGNTITLTAAGTLSQAISEDEKYTITNLKIIGFLNGDDIRLIREMAGRDVEGNETEGHLTDLDISGATIVEGGGAYFIRNLGEYYNYEVEKHYTLNDVITSFMFYETILENISLPQGVVDISLNAFYNCSSLASINIPDAVTSIGSSSFRNCILLEEVSISSSSFLSSISYSAFEGCSSLISINIPDGVATIYDKAFKGCTLLEEVSISPQSALNSIGESAFSGCSSLISINIPDGVTSIGKFAFNGCTLLEEVFITPQSALTSIGRTAFQSCSSLTDITIPDGVKEIESYTFFGCTSLSDVSITSQSSLNSIDSLAFYNCSSLTDIIIPDGVTSIGNKAFRNCTSLANVAISPQSALVSIGVCAFQDCSFLMSINIPDGVIELGVGAFYSCSSLSYVNIPDGVTEIGNGTFAFCSSLTSITIPDGVTSIAEWAFTACHSLADITISSQSSLKSIGEYAFWGCSSLTSINIPDCVTDIGDLVFCDCTLLEEVSISPQSALNSIGESAFSGCSSITDIIIPDGVTLIEYGTFAYCSSLTSINIPAGITEISKNAFYGCSSLSEVTCNATNPPTLDLSAFEGITSPSTCYVPSGTYIDYILSDWAQCFTTIDDGEEHEYVELLVNGDAEGEDFSCFVSREARGGLITSRVTEAGMGADGVGRAYVVASDDMVEATWDTQFFVVSTEALNEGDIISFSMKYKADKEASTVSMWYENPELYLHWDAVGNPYFETEWQEYNTFSVINSGVDGCKSIGFSLNEFEEANTYYFDDISLKVLKR